VLLYEYEQCIDMLAFARVCGTCVSKRKFDAGIKDIDLTKMLTTGAILSEIMEPTIRKIAENEVIRDN